MPATVAFHSTCICILGNGMRQQHAPAKLCAILPIRSSKPLSRPLSFCHTQVRRDTDDEVSGVMSSTGECCESPSASRASAASHDVVGRSHNSAQPMIDDMLGKHRV